MQLLIADVSPRRLTYILSHTMYKLHILYLTGSDIKEQQNYFLHHTTKSKTKLALAYMYHKKYHCL